MPEKLEDRYLKYLELFNKYPYSTYEKPTELEALGVIVRYVALRKKHGLSHIDMTKRILTDLEELISALRDGI